ncbi:hypothetical protein A0H81_05920 [Grifola frondosa]|uniref:Uncharacterized protein n=1 Tax=Grifola frondosa TaxID=5627 RepID=A0A1C7MB98_GRIFR|nr:hypothetical protein A0H81_05920 [Grifola frondosa]
MLSSPAGDAVELTNAQRLVAGLPPLRPKFRRTFPGQVQNRDDPTPAFGAKRAAASVKPVTFNGRIQATYTSNNTVAGFIENLATGLGGLRPFNVIATNAAFKAPFFIGINGTITTTVTGIISLDIGLGSPNTLGLTNVGQTIWSFNSRTTELTPQWINPDGSKPITTIAYDVLNNVLFITGDLVSYNSTHPAAPASEVKFFLASA